MTLEKNKSDFRESALDVIENESKAIAQLRDCINETFTQACELLLTCTGRIIVIGIGKSGHIARKIAATFASMGSPAFFIHPAEANHGDMGMIIKGDVILAISNSGETAELISLLPQIKRLNLPMISLTGNPNSTLAETSTLHLNIPVVKEACPLGLAPTTSTTVMLVMGDALAVALLKARGLTQNDFANFHPGGTLGKRLTLRIKDIMQTDERIPSVKKNTLLSDTLVEMTKKRLGMTTIIDDHQKPLGVFTDGDLRRALTKPLNLHKTIVDDLMTKSFKTLPPDALACDALDLMEMHKITALLITDDQSRLVGVLHLHHILSA